MIGFIKYRNINWTLINILTLLLFLFLCLSCDKNLEIIPTTAEETEHFIHVDFSLTHLENTEELSEIRLLAFNEDGNCAINTLLSFNGKTSIPLDQLNINANISDPIKLPLGNYEFLFIANETSKLLTNNFRSSLRNLKNKALLYRAPFTHVQFSEITTREIITDSKIPMSAYYKNIKLEKVENSISNPFRYPYKIDLIRAFAKVEINIANTSDKELSFKRIKNIKLSNIADFYSVPAQPRLYYELYPKDKTISLDIPVNFTEEDYKKKDVGQLTVYIPEFLRSNLTDTKEFSKLIFKGEGFYDYELKLMETKSYEDFKSQPRTWDILRLSNSSIIRNTFYKINLNLTSNRDLEAVLEVLPWTKVGSGIHFTQPQWEKSSFSILVNGIERKNNKIIELKTGEEAIIKFKLNEPTGGIWKASLTNGAQFEFSPDSESRGIAGREYQIKIRASNKWDGTPQLTEFYIAVDGKELPLLANSEGLGNRYIFKQTE